MILHPDSPDTAPDSLLLRLIGLESRAGRVEGHFAADPELGRMWRAQAALTEACRSVALEDIHAFEGDIVHRHLENRATGAEVSRGTAAALDLLGIIAAPGDLRADPEGRLERAWRAAVSVEEEGGELELPATARAVAESVAAAPTPILGAIRAAAVHRAMTDSRMPSADRLVFLMAEHALRDGARGRELWPDYPEALLRRLDAAWICTPSIALTQARFRAWSPGSTSGFADLISGLEDELARTLGAMPRFRRWRDDARELAEGRHGKSRLRDLVDLAIHEPILNAGRVKTALGCSERAALYLVKEAEEAGILTLITPRRTWRVWATPMMAETLRMRAEAGAGGAGRARAAAGGGRAASGEDHALEDAAPLRARDVAEGGGQEAALAELDAALAKADAVLAKYRTP